MTTELDRENPDFPPYLISHGQKIGLTCVLLATRLEVADCVCATLQVWSTQCECNISTLEVAQSYSVSLHSLFGKDRPKSTQFLLHSWLRNYTWRYRKSRFTLSNSVVFTYFVLFRENKQTEVKSDKSNGESYVHIKTNVHNNFET